jgi:branched-chain amino acid transport system substrate-binding protein
MLKKITLIIVVLGLFSLYGCAGDQGGETGEGKTYRIGLITALSGPMGQYGQEQKKLLEARVAELNQKNDYTIELIAGDGQCDGNAAVQTLRKLAGEEKVKFFVGGYCAGVTMAMAPVLEEMNAVLITPTTTNPALEGLSPNVFSLAYADTLLAGAVQNELADYDRFATLTENTEASGLLEKTLDNQISAAGREDKLVFDQSFASGGEGVAEMIEELEKSGAEAIFINVESREGALAALRALEAAGVEMDLLGSAKFDDETLLAEAPELVNGMKIIERPEVTSTALEGFLENLTAETILTEGLLDGYFVASTLDALDLMARLVSDNNGDLESEMQAFNTGIFSGFLGRLHFDGKNFRQGVEATVKVVKERRAEKN